MKFVTPEISWHERDPVYSVDFQPALPRDCFNSAGISVGRLATCGTDKNIRLWSLKFDENGRTSVDFLSTLSRHSRAVNIVRFSPDGKILASAGDDAVIMLWAKSSLAPASSLFQEDEVENKETWTVFKMLRSHLEDVYDLSWSADGSKMVSGSVDNTAILWDVMKGHKLCILNDHKSIVQGVAFDPLEKFFASMSCDRSCRIFSLKTLNVVNEIKKASLPLSSYSGNQASSSDQPRPVRLFHDDTMKSFFRRLSFSPDGLLLLVPSGCIDSAPLPTTVAPSAPALLNTTYVFSRQNFSRPVAHLPCGSKASVCVRFCPILFELFSDNSENIENCKNKIDGSEADRTRGQANSVFDLPYRMIFSIATESSILIYDTQYQKPFAYISNMHYHTLSDMTWSHDGRVLVISSTDGFCTIVTFSNGELGTPYTPPPPPEPPAVPVVQETMKEKDSGIPVSDGKQSTPCKISSPAVTKSSLLQRTNSPSTPSNSSSAPKTSANERSRSVASANGSTVGQPRRIQLTVLACGGFSGSTVAPASKDGAAVVEQQSNTVTEETSKQAAIPSQLLHLKEPEISCSTVPTATNATGKSTECDTVPVGSGTVPAGSGAVPAGSGAVPADLVSSAKSVLPGSVMTSAGSTPEAAIKSGGTPRARSEVKSEGKPARRIQPITLFTVPMTSKDVSSPGKPAASSTNLSEPVGNTEPTISSSVAESISASDRLTVSKRDESSSEVAGSIETVGKSVEMCTSINEAEVMEIDDSSTEVDGSTCSKDVVAHSSSPAPVPETSLAEPMDESDLHLVLETSNSAMV